MVGGQGFGVVGDRRKLIEVALPLDAINAASAREKSIRHGHPSTLHLWWARRPLAACRAVLFASLVDDPSARPDRFPTEEAQDRERERLFGLIGELVLWESSNNPDVLGRARAEIAASCDGGLPAVLDPCAGGGSIPLEAQHLGLEAHAGDLNPVAVLINKALVEIPPRFAGRAPVNPQAQEAASQLGSWAGAQGLAADVKHYGKWMRDQAEKRIGRLYPKVDLPAGHGGGEATVIAWLWTRTATCPNPVCGAEAPLASSWWLSKKKGREAWVNPVVDEAARTVRYEIGAGPGGPPEAPKQGRAQFACIFCGAAIPGDGVKAQAQTGGLGARLMAVVAQGDRRRVYLPPTPEHEQQALACLPPTDPPAGRLPDEALGFRVQRYGMTEWADLFTARQLTALCQFSGLVDQARDQARADALAAGMSDDPTPLRDGGTGATAYAEAVSVYLAFAASKCADYWSNGCSWLSAGDTVGHVFARQAISMIWDFAEANPFSGSTGNWLGMVDWTQKALAQTPAEGVGAVVQRDAAASGVSPAVVSCDPPYYDNIGYADLSDFFYVWLRRSLGGVFPEVCSTLLAPKADELIAAPYRHGGDKQAAKAFFEDGLGQVFAKLREAQDRRFPMSVYYAFKQAETTDSGGTASTGWETFLEGLVGAGLQITGTWPMRTERPGRTRQIASNALASSIVLVCRPRPDEAPTASRREFLDRLAAELPDALGRLRAANIAPVDLAQAAIGPGMAVYSRYSRVIEADGTPMGIRAALAAVNAVLDETLDTSDAELDADSRWALTWFAAHGFEPGGYGQAEQLSKARNTSVQGLVDAGIAESRAGKVRLLARHELDEHWNPAADRRPTAWEAVNHLARALETGGEQPAAALLRQLGGLADAARDLAYRLHHTADRRGQTADAFSYNALIQTWPELTLLAHTPPETQAHLGFNP